MAVQKKQWITILLSLLCAVATAQDSNFRVVGASAIPGLPVVCRIEFDHTSDCEAFSLGVSHDPSVLSISNLQRGFYLEGANPGGVSPDFSDARKQICSLGLDSLWVACLTCPLRSSI